MGLLSNVVHSVSFDLYSVCAIIPAAFFLAMSVLFFSMKQKSRATFYFGLELLLLSLFFFWFFIAVTVDHPVAAYYRFMIIFTVDALGIVMLLFIFSFPVVTGPSLIKKIIFAYALCGAILRIWDVFYKTQQLSPVYIFERYGFDFNVDTLSMRTAVWIYSLVIISLSVGIYRVIRLKIPHKLSTTAIIILLPSIAFIPAATSTLASYGYLSLSTYYLSQDFVYIGGYFIASVIYINTTKDRSSFLVKVIGISLATFLLILQVLSFISLKDQERSYDQIAQRDALVTFYSGELTPDMVFFVRYDTNGKQTAFIGNYPGASKTANDTGIKTWIYEQIKNRNGFISRNTAAQLFSQKGNSTKGYAAIVDTFIASQGSAAPASLVIRKINSLSPDAERLNRQISLIPAESFPLKAAQTIRSESDDTTRILADSAIEAALSSGKSGESCKQLVLSMIEPMHPSGTRRFITDSRGKRYAVFTIINNGEICEAGFSYEGYRTYLHPLARSYVIALGIISFVIIVGFRFFFLNTITRPLRFIETGIREVEKGNINIQVPVIVEDEIGHIAHTFNTMIEKISDAESTLEQKVLDRTTQLDTLNKELSSTLQLLNGAQADLVRREKMAGLGDMVAGVAHEINTPIGVSLTAATFLEKKTNDIAVETAHGSLTRSALDSFLSTTMETSKIITSNLGRAAELISSFKKVAVAQTTEEEGEFRVEQYIHDLLLNLRPALKKTKISVVVECDETLTITSYPGAFSQIITNMVMNTIIHGFTPEQPGTVIIRVRKQEENILIEYSDDGAGIPLNNIQKIFEPFFTTSRNKGGTGLGLHIIYNIVTQKLKGTITAASVEGKGVKFIITFPLLKI